MMVQHQSVAQYLGSKDYEEVQLGGDECQRVSQ
jgi:hypothetical protein